MKAAFVIAAVSFGLVWASGTASAAPLTPASPAPVGYEYIGKTVEPVHYRRHRVRRHYRPHVFFGLAPFATPYYAYPYRYHYSAYPYRYYRYPAYGYGRHYGYGPRFGFGFHISR